MEQGVEKKKGKGREVERVHGTSPGKDGINVSSRGWTRTRPAEFVPPRGAKGNTIP